MGLVELRGREGEPEVRALLALAHAPASSLERAAERYRDRTWLLVGWEEDGRLVACAGVERDADEIVVRSLAVSVASRGRGIGRSLVQGIVGVATARALVAEADDGSVGFYERCGFAVQELEPSGERRRFRCSRPIAADPAPADQVRAFTLADLELAIRESWGRDTSDDPDEWSDENPARGQCAVTALLVRDLLGGEILVANVLRDGERVDRHAWNRLPSGVSIDLTRSQFRNGEEYEEPTVGEPLLVSRDRCELLAERVRAQLATSQ